MKTKKQLIIIVIVFLFIFSNCKKEKSNNLFYPDNYRRTEQSANEAMYNSYLAGLENSMPIEKNNDSTESKADLLRMENGYFDFIKTYLDRDKLNHVFSNLDSNNEYHYPYKFDSAYYSCIYIPNIKNMIDTLSPIYCNAFGLSSEYGENSIYGFYIDHHDTIKVLLEEREALSSFRPVLIYDFIEKNIAIATLDSSCFIDTLINGNKTETEYNHFFFSRYQINYRYENDNNSELYYVYRISYPSGSGVYYTFYTNYGQLASVYKTNIGFLFSCWNSILNPDGGTYSPDFALNHSYGIFGLTYEHDWPSGMQHLSVTIPYDPNGTGIIFDFRAQHSYDYYQIISNSLTQIPQGWYLSLPQKGDLWIHHWN